MSINDLRLSAGWYADPQNPNAERWWNGSQWTSHTREADLPWDSTGLEGQPPTAWLAPDSRLVTVSAAPTAQVFDHAGLAEVAQPLNIPAGWYPDPTGLPAQRWWDGQGWSDRTAPLADRQRFGDHVPVAAAPYYPPAVVLVSPPKSVAVAFLLTFFFGPLGMLYSTVSGALIMLGVLFIGSFMVAVATFGLGLILWWPMIWLTSVVWGCVAASQAPTTQIVNAGPAASYGYRGYPPNY